MQAAIDKLTEIERRHKLSEAEAQARAAVQLLKLREVAQAREAAIAAKSALASASGPVVDAQGDTAMASESAIAAAPAAVVPSDKSNPPKKSPVMPRYAGTKREKSNPKVPTPVDPPQMPISKKSWAQAARLVREGSGDRPADIYEYENAHSEIAKLPKVVRAWAQRAWRLIRATIQSFRPVVELDEFDFGPVELQVALTSVPQLIGPIDPTVEVWNTVLSGGDPPAEYQGKIEAGLEQRLFYKF
jgi:hypothetical protein